MFQENNQAFDRVKQTNLNDMPNKAQKTGLGSRT